MFVLRYPSEPFFIGGIVRAILVLMEKSIAVLYHAECPDGFAAAYSAWKKFGDSALYIGVYHQTLPPSEVYGKEVYLLDYSYKLDVIKDLLPKVKSLKIIDHHVSNEEQVRLTDGVYDISHSGCVLSWKFFHPDEGVPRLLQHIEDIDLWTFRLANTREIAEMITIYDFDFNVWDKIVSECETDSGLEKYVKEGVILLRKLDKSVKKIVNDAEEIEFEGYKCLLANSPVYTSQVGAALVEKMPPIGMIWARRKNKVVVLLRSDGTVDVAKLAEKYGGGGHRAASGFLWEEKDFLKFKGRH